MDGKDFRDMTVIGHKNPDTDSICSAIALAEMLNTIGIHARAARAGSLNNETKYILSLFDVQEPELITRAEDQSFILVDHSSYSQAIDGLRSADVQGIIDHHDGRDIRSDHVMFVRCEPAGAAASLVYREFRKRAFQFSQKTAGLLLAAILSDTRNMTRNVTEADQTAFEALKAASGIADTDALYRKMKEALVSYGDMSDQEIFFSDYKEYEAEGIRYCIADTNAYGEAAVREMAERMHEMLKQHYEASSLQYAFSLINNKGDDPGENGMYMTAYPEEAVQLLQEAFGTCDGTGCFIFRDNLSRKTAVVPAINAILRKSKAETV